MRWWFYKEGESQRELVAQGDRTFTGFTNNDIVYLVIANGANYAGTSFDFTVYGCPGG